MGITCVEADTTHVYRRVEFHRRRVEDQITILNI